VASGEAYTLCRVIVLDRFRPGFRLPDHGGEPLSARSFLQKSLEEMASALSPFRQRVTAGLPEEGFGRASRGAAASTLLNRLTGGRDRFVKTTPASPLAVTDNRLCQGQQTDRVIRIGLQPFYGFSELNAKGLLATPLATTVHATDRHRVEMKFQAFVPIFLFGSREDKRLPALNADLLLVGVEVMGNVAMRTEFLLPDITAHGPSRKRRLAVWITDQSDRPSGQRKGSGLFFGALPVFTCEPRSKGNRTAESTADLFKAQG